MAQKTDVRHRLPACGGNGGLNRAASDGKPDQEKPGRHGEKPGRAQGAVRFAHEATHGAAHAAGRQGPAQAFQNEGQAHGPEQKGHIEIHAPW